MFDTFVFLQKHHSAALPDHHPGEEIPQGPPVPGRAAECPRGSQGQVGRATFKSMVSNSIIQNPLK